MQLQSTEQRKDSLTQEIKNMKNGQIEEMALVSFYSLESYFKSLFTFGSKSSTTKDTLNVIKEMFQIVKRERTIFNYILNNMEQFNVDAIEDVVTILDDLNDKTLEYYYRVIDEIEDAIDMKDERRSIRPRKNFDTLTQTDSYARDVIALAERKSDIKSFLGYEEEFWQYIKGIERSVEVTSDIAQEIAYVTALIDNDNKVSGMKLLVPDVVDLKTALTAIKCYAKAYNLYKMIGKDYDKDKQVDYSVLQDEYQEMLGTKSHSLIK